MDRLWRSTPPPPLWSLEEEQQQLRGTLREKRLKEHTEIWLQQILPHYTPGSRPTRRMERLWRQGLPPKVREVLWPMAIGNVLRITPELFEIHKQQALDARRAEAGRQEGHVDASMGVAESSRIGRERSTECIPVDLLRTFPNLAFFKQGEPMHEDCARILEAYCFFRPDVGYVQGMSYLAAVLLLYLAPYPAFVGLCNLISSPSVLGLYRLEPKAVECRARVFRQLCGAQLPAVARVIDEAGLTPEMFLIEWFMTLYAKCLPIEVAPVVWDLFLLDGEVVLYCTAIALLRILEPSLLRGPSADLEMCARILGKELRRRVCDPDELLWHIREVWRRTPRQLLQEINSIANLEFGPGGGGRSAVAAGTTAGIGAGGMSLGPVLANWRDSLARWAW